MKLKAPYLWVVFSLTACGGRAPLPDLVSMGGTTPGATAYAPSASPTPHPIGDVVIAFEDGSRGIASGSDNWLGGMESRLQLLAARCRLECNLSPLDALQAYAPDVEVFGDEPLLEKLDTGAGWSRPMPDADWTSGHLPMCQAVTDAIASGADLPGDADLGIDVTSLVYAAYLSAAEGRRVEMSELAAAES